MIGNRFDIAGIGGPPTFGLSRLVAGILGVTIPKSNNLARSHWSLAPLSKRRVAYAARDAWAAAAILHKLSAMDEANNNRFLPLALIRDLDEQHLLSIEEVSIRAAKRKIVKRQLKGLKSLESSGFSEE